MQQNLERWLRAYLDRNDVGERKAGEMLGCGENIFATVFRRRAVPQIETLQRIADKRSIRLSDLIREVEDFSPQ